MAGSRWAGYVETAARPRAGHARRFPERPAAFPIAPRRPLQTGDILLFFCAFLAPLEVIRYRNYSMPGALQGKYGFEPMTVVGTYEPYLVALSFAVACLASYSALDLGGRITVSRRWARLAWLATAAIAMGGGIWSM